MPIEFFPFCLLSTRKIRCIVLTIGYHDDLQSRSWKICQLGCNYVFSIG